MTAPRILTANLEIDNLYDIDSYERLGGYSAIRKALNIAPDKIVSEVKESGLRGRGGAGFPTGMKWGFVAKNTGKPTYILMNADESEPGTFKDRLLLEKTPHLCIEGLLIAAWALGANWAAIYIRGEYAYAATRITHALRQAYSKGYVGKNIFNSQFSVNIVLHRGAGAYICGEETALIESLEGKRGQPRNKPPFPAVSGLYDCPTVVNNVETLANLSWIINNSGAEYKKIGTEKSPGTKLFSASGHINNPGVYEIELGYPLMKFIENECGGVRNGRKLKAVIPGGSSVPILRADECKDLKLDYEALREKGTFLGSGGFIVIDETANMREVCANLQHFYSHESCGQCVPCREGVGWVEKIVSRIHSGKGKSTDIALVSSITEQIAGHTICPFGDALVTPITSFMKKFPEEFAVVDGAILKNEQR